MSTEAQPICRMLNVGRLLWTPALKVVSIKQWFFYSRNNGLVTPKIIHFHYPKKHSLDRSIQKNNYLILKTEALVLNTHYFFKFQ